MIDATLASIAEIGLIRTSVSEIIDRAGLSRGMIHLHFKGKENLIAAAAEYSYHQYYARLDAAVAQGHPDPQFRIESMVLCDLSEAGLNEHVTRLNHEFQGGVRAYPALAPHADTRDIRLRAMFDEAFLALLTATGQDDPKAFAHDLTVATVSMVEGMWVDFMLHPENFDRNRAARIIFRMLAGALPSYFDLEGAKVPHT